MKDFATDEVGIACFRRELLARYLYRDRPWLAPAIKTGPNWLVTPLYPDELRLDRIAPSLDPSAREEIVGLVGWMLLDVLRSGHALRNLSAKNLFWVKDCLLLTDFETIEEYPQGRRPPLATCYDLTGQGLESPFSSLSMYYANSEQSDSLSQVLKVPAKELVDAMIASLKVKLEDSSKTFKARRGRFTFVSRRMLTTFSLPYLTVTNQESRRDSSKRMERFGIHGDSLRGRSVLDLGSHCGGILFEVQRLGPGRCVGVEYDLDKVETAKDVAAFNGLNNVEFIHADIDHLDAKRTGGPFDCVFCLAIETWVTNKPRLYRLLSEVSADMLYFEGNAGTDIASVENGLRSNGFREVRYIGMCDDDCQPEGNIRPQFIARK